MQNIYTQLTTRKYKHYIKTVKKCNQYNPKSKEFKTYAYDVLATFLNYYRHIGTTPTLQQNQKYALLVIDQFQTVIKKYHLTQSLSKLSATNLLKAMSASLNVMMVWYYALKHRLYIYKIDFTRMDTEKDAINSIHEVEHRIRVFNQTCIDFYIGKKRARFIVKIPMKQLRMRKNKKRS